MVDSLSAVKAYFAERQHEPLNYEEQVSFQTARSLSIGYCLYYAEDELVCRGAEVPFTLPVLDPETGAETGMKYSGIIDRFIQDKHGNLYCGDYKTASQVGPAYWEELSTNPQLSQYYLGCRQAGIPVVGFFWDVIVKPGIKPKKLTKAAIAELESGDYCGLPFAPGYHDEEEETPEMYGQRVLVDCTSNADRYFQRRIINRRDEDVYEYMQDLYAIVMDVDRCKQSGQFYRNLSACKRYGKLCEYHSICSGVDRGKGQFVTRPSVDAADRPTEKGSYSPSRLTCFARCHREYEYKYEEKLEPAKFTTDASLAIGSYLHGALEVWMQSRLKDPISFDTVAV